MVDTQFAKAKVDFIGAGQYAGELRGWADSGKANFLVARITTSERLFAVENDFFVAIGNVKNRDVVALQALENALRPCSLLTVGRVLICDDASLGRGCLVTDGATVASGVEIGDFVDIHGGARLGHGVRLGRSCSIGANVFIGGETTLGDRVQVFPGVQVAPGISICDDVIIGIGSVVIKSIHRPGTYFGNPAKRLF